MTSGSRFHGARFARLMRVRPERVPPQAVTAELAAIWSCVAIAAWSPAGPTFGRTDPKHQHFHMADIPFDTLAVTGQPEARGFNSARAEAITEAVRAGVSGEVTTRTDLMLIRDEISELRTELKWTKVIGATILAVLVLPWLAEPISATIPGP